jgi:hypothetical protein
MKGMLPLVKNSLMKEKCEMRDSRDETANSLSQTFAVKSLHIFMQSPKIVTIVCRNDCLACQDEFFVNSPLDIKENYEHALDFAHHLSHLSRSR